MIVVMPILAVFYFSLYIYLKLQYGPNHATWPIFIFSIIYFGIAGITHATDNLALVFLPLMASAIFAFITAFVIQRRNAGTLILTYRRNASNTVYTIIIVVMILFISYFISIPNVRIYPGGDLVYDDSYFHERLPMSIFFGLVGLAYIFLIFRKGEFLEKGFATPDLQFYPWNGYSSYRWLEYAKNKNEERFSLLLQGKKGASHTVRGFSENTKNILDDVLKQKYPRQNHST